MAVALIIYCEFNEFLRRFGDCELDAVIGEKPQVGTSNAGGT